MFSRSVFRSGSHRRLDSLLTVLFLGLAATCPGADWVRAGVDSEKPIWGLRGGLQFAIHPGGFTWNEGGPRGLIRIGYPTLPEGEYDLINFIAVEPVVGRARGLSELEKSAVDGKQGKVFFAGPGGSGDGVKPSSFDPGTITSLPNGVEALSVPVRIEKFANGAHVRLVLRQRSDAPDELTITVYSEPGSAPIDACVLTATMGNKARTRLLWLNDGPVSSLTIFGEYRETHFTRHAFFPLERLPRSTTGDVVVATTTDEADPARSRPQPSRGWRYRGEKVTQYWRKPAANLHESLRCAVNARFTYWMSQNPIPGGLAYENFELIENFRDGQTFTFGVTKRSPGELLK
jgi:hypothetical protein